MRRNFNEAFDGETTDLSAPPNDWIIHQAQIQQLEEQLKEMRSKFKKEEATKRQSQDIARRKDEEIKKFQADIKQMEC